MIEELITTVIKRMKEEYPQLDTPIVMKASVVSAKKGSEVHKQTVFLTDTQTGDKREYLLEQPYYTYAVKILDNRGSTLDNYPTLPNIKGHREYQVGDVVTVAFTGGEMQPVIVEG